QAARAAAAGKPFAFTAQARKIGAGAGAIFEQARLAHPEVHDAAVVDEVVIDALDEAGMRLRMLVSRLRLGQLAGFVVDVIVALAGTVDAIGPVQAGVEPLRRVRRDHLHGKHVAELVMEGGGVVFRGEIAALPAPIGPAAGEAVEHLLGGELADKALFLRQAFQRLGVGDRAPQPRWHALFLDLLQARGNARFAEIFLGKHVGGDLRPGRGDLDIVEAEHDGAVGILDLRCRQSEINPCVGCFTLRGVATFDSHSFLAPSLVLTAPPTPTATVRYALSRTSQAAGNPADVRFAVQTG